MEVELEVLVEEKLVEEVLVVVVAVTVEGMEVAMAVENTISFYIVHNLKGIPSLALK